MGGRAARRIAIALVVLVVLLVAADRIGNYAAERTAGNTIQSSQDLSSRPDVDIGGFPFLTQLAAGKFDQVTITAHDVPVARTANLLRISDIRVVLGTVTVSRDFSRVSAATADATATITFADLSRVLGVNVGYAGGGRIRATKKVTVLGSTVAASLTTQPALVNGGLAFTATSINNAGQLGAAVTSGLNKVFDVGVPLQGIPFKISVVSLRVESQGVVIALTGRNLSYSK
jgi:DUF2993 family protein